MGEFSTLFTEGGRRPPLTPPFVIFNYGIFKEIRIENFCFIISSFRKLRNARLHVAIATTLLLHATYMKNSIF